VPLSVEYQDEAGRLWDVLYMLRVASDGGPEVRYGVHVCNSDRERMPPLIQLKVLCGPNEHGSPCITVLLPKED
jgi:hypothetical protein